MSQPLLLRTLRDRRFRLLFAGITVSRVGDAMTFIVVSWLALEIGGPRAVGFVVLTGGIFAPLSSPILGLLIDRLGLRLLMAIDNLGRGALMIGLAALIRYGHLRLGYLVLFAAASALLSPATEIGQNVAVPALLPPDQLDAANSLMSSSWDVAAWLGPAFAGFAIKYIGSAPVLLIDAGTFFIMTAIAPALPGRAEPDPADESQSGAPVARLLTGFRVLWQLRPVAMLTVLAVGDLFLGGMMEVFLPAFNKITLHQGPAGYGLLVSIAGLASLCGTLFLTPLVTRFGHGRALAIVLIARAVTVAPLALARSWALAAVLVAAAAVPDGSFFPVNRTIAQRLTPARLRGRVQGAKGLVGAAGFPLGSAVGGLAVASLGGHLAAVIMALGYLPLAALVFLTPQVMAFSARAGGLTAAGDALGQSGDG